MQQLPLKTNGRNNRQRERGAGGREVRWKACKLLTSWASHFFFFLFLCVNLFRERVRERGRAWPKTIGPPDLPRTLTMLWPAQLKVQRPPAPTPPRVLLSPAYLLCIQPRCWSDNEPFIVEVEGKDCGSLLCLFWGCGGSWGGGGGGGGGGVKWEVDGSGEGGREHTPEM